MTLGGGESITQCSGHNNDWCCNGDAQHVNCCQESPSPRPFFALQDGNAYATIGSNQASNNPTLSTITGLASSTGSSSPSSQTSASASSAGSHSATAPSGAFTSLQTSLSSGSAGVQTIVVTALISPTAAPNSGVSQLKSGNSNIGVIVGCALGIPLAIALAGIIFWILRKRRQERIHPYKETPDNHSNRSSTPNFTGGAAARLGKDQMYRQSLPGTTEIDSQPVGPGRPISTIQGLAELESGTVFSPGHGTPYGPDTVGLGGGNGHNRASWGSTPPQYSPGMNQAAFGHRRKRFRDGQCSDTASN